MNMVIKEVVNAGMSSGYWCNLQSFKYRSRGFKCCVIQTAYTIRNKSFP